MAQEPYASPFEGAGVYYDRFRAPYPRQALDHVRASFNLDGRSRALDLGCGPGTIAIPLSDVVGEVVAVDPDAAMLEEGRRLAEQRRNIRWLRLRAEELPPDLGRFRVVTMGQSFHWMERDRVLQRLAELVEDGGGLALINPGKRRPQESWEMAAAAVVTKYLGVRERHPGANPQEPAHEPALLRSALFNRFTVREFPSKIERDIASILGWLYSSSGAAKCLFGDNAPAFERELKEVLLDLNPSGVFKERLETEVMIVPKAPA